MRENRRKATVPLMSARMFNSSKVLDEIWMVATMHAELNRRKLDKLNVIHICKEILNFSAPKPRINMRLSAILMDGVVIVYEQKMKLLYGDNLLDDVDDSYFNIDPQEHIHQARPEDITLPLYERFESCEVNTCVFNPFERFYTKGDDGRVDTEGDEGTQPNFSYGEHATIINSPPPEEVERAEEIPDHQVKSNLGEQDEQRQGPVKRKGRKQASTAMDCGLTVIANNKWNSWLQDTSDIVSRRGTKEKVSRNIISTMKVGSLMELPPTIFIGDSFSNDIYYPKPLMELWMKSTQPAYDSPSARTSPPLPPEPSISLPETERHQYQEAMGFNFEDFHGGGEASDSLGVSIEQFRTDVANYEIPVDILMGEQSANLRNHHGLNRTGASFSTPANDGHDIPPLYAELNLERSNKKIHSSSSGDSGSSLQPIAEELTRQSNEPNFKLLRQSEKQPMISEADDGMGSEMLTHSIRMRMKSYFEAPRAPQEESLNTFATGNSE